MICLYWHGLRIKADINARTLHDVLFPLAVLLELEDLSVYDPFDC